MKTFGSIALVDEQWQITGLQPHVSIKLKAIFQSIPKGSAGPFKFNNTPENCDDLGWFTERYPLEVSSRDFMHLQRGRQQRQKTIEKLEAILQKDYTNTQEMQLNDGMVAREYQIKGAAFHAAKKRMLLGDDLGLGKTLTGILTMLNPATRPALVVVQTHLPRQWKDEIQRFTGMTVHIIKQTKPYELPTADVYIVKYSFLTKWVDFFATGFFKSVVFDEVQELRRSESQRYSAAQVLTANVEYCMGMSATPIYNYGDEIFNVQDLLVPGCLGNRDDFLREWTYFNGRHHIVNDPQALGMFLRDNYLFLRRTRAEVGRELPPLNKIVQVVGYDDTEIKKSDDIARMLAITVMEGSFTERGQAARELNALVRHQTGVAKAKEVAAYCRILLENGEPVLLAGWHRDVYEIWQRELEDFNPVMYTGSETPTQKQAAKDDFCSGKTNLFIISLRSGIGLDGLQHRCNNVMIGELDWSPQVHNQVIGRVDRDGNLNQTTVYYPVCEFGSDPVIMELLGLKSSQSHGIVNPFEGPSETFSDESHMRLLAESYLKREKSI